MKNSTKYYKKAVQQYNEGNLDKALNLCEKSISISLKNSAAVNLKGLLLYLKGELLETEGVWKLNRDYNKDEVARKYLENLKNDKEKLSKYERALEIMKHMDFREALVLLTECSKSDFNAIEVNNALCKVYIHLGRYEEAKTCIDKVISIDRKNKSALQNRNLLIEYRVIDGGSIKKKIFTAIFLITIVAATWTGSLLIKHSKTDTNSMEQKDNIISLENSSVKENEKIEMKVPSEKKTPRLFPTEQLNTAVSNRDFDTIFNLLNNNNLDTLTGEDKTAYQRGMQLMKDEGITYFYKVGRENHLEDKYEEALKQYSKGEVFGEGSYLYADILYMSGDCYQFLNKIDKAIEYYEKYLSLNPSSGYTDTVLYQLVVIYKDTDINKAKIYAGEIKNKFGNSIYNNSVVNYIVNLK